MIEKLSGLNVKLHTLKSSQNGITNFLSRVSNHLEFFSFKPGLVKKVKEGKTTNLSIFSFQQQPMLNKPLFDVQMGDPERKVIIDRIKSRTGKRLCR